ncbi:MAG: hypothetical protein WCS27_11525 [Victivallaceae bacterium]
MKERVFWAVIASTLFVLSGCRTPTIESLSRLNLEVPVVEKPLAAKVCLCSWIDRRKTISKYGWWSIVPLVPYATSEFQENENDTLAKSCNAGLLKTALIRVYSGDTQGELTGLQLENGVLLSLARALHKSRIFKKEDHAPEAGAEYTIQPVLLQWKEKNWITTYMIGYCGPLLWGLGFPYGEKHWEVEFVLILKETKSNKSLLVKNYSTKTDSHLIGVPLLFGWCFYYRSIASSFEAQDLAPFFEESIADFIVHLKETLKERHEQD